MNRNRMKQIILEYIKRHEGTSFVEIEQLFEDNHFNYKGNGTYSSGEHHNVIFWSGWNKQAFNIIAELRTDGHIVMNICELIIYMVDGKYLSLPVLRKPSDAKNECWLPITFSKSKVA
ncbi:TPA: pathogenicity island protein [Staphylococcus aureus]|uniref:pathogenicity island protein n=1 Tax=Staphylococcus aureus TaxID=1280 RepID=UPI0019602A75|nr:pathogenicity island protein [Staphylococcus aureus]MCB4384542.1 pathogenicity island protein [Staphylococcus aureus]MCB4392258.1 pathogenicity island protein [Staphylococcus aureus]MDT1928114.1 pathogenicity island protein [Staphylococcus aureus]MDT1965657.1 pathogenicity island protein [Staphylococcus aureus]MDT1968888.1 pathogenicity island protein [Staphylococcus aureus]